MYGTTFGDFYQDEENWRVLVWGRNQELCFGHNKVGTPISLKNIGVWNSKEIKITNIYLGIITLLMQLKAWGWLGSLGKVLYGQSWEDERALCPRGAPFRVQMSRGKLSGQWGRKETVKAFHGGRSVKRFLEIGTMIVLTL